MPRDSPAHAWVLRGVTLHIPYGASLAIVGPEPSAGLDAAAEYEIHASLREHRLARTSLLISHRLGTLRDADTIAVLADGRVVEQGEHAALLASGSRCARLFALQASGYRQGDEGRTPPSEPSAVGAADGAADQ